MESLKKDWLTDSQVLSDLAYELDCLIYKNVDQALERVTELIKFARQENHPTAEAAMLSILAHIQTVRGRTGEGVQIATQAVEILRESDNKAMLVRGLTNLDHTVAVYGSHSTSIEVTEEPIALAE